MADDARTLRPLSKGSYHGSCCTAVLLGDERIAATIKGGRFLAGRRLLSGRKSKAKAPIALDTYRCC
jgi:hypothetical protein